MTEQDAKPILRAFVAQHLRTENDDDLRFFAAGLVNSLFAMQIVLFVEQRFGITVENEDLEMANFESVAALARLVARKSGGPV